MDENIKFNCLMRNTDRCQIEIKHMRPSKGRTLERLEVIRRIKPESVGSCEPAEVSNSLEHVQLMNMVESMANEMINGLPSASD